MNWTYVVTLGLNLVGVLVTVGVLWGTLKASLAETRDDVKEIKDVIKPLAALPELVHNTREDVKELRDRLREVERNF